MLSDSSHEIRQQADAALSEFLQEIKNSPVRPHSRNLLCLYVFLREWTQKTFCQCIFLQLSLSLYKVIFMFYAFNADYSTLNEKNVDYGRMAEILVRRAGSTDEFTRLTSITWVILSFIYVFPVTFNCIEAT